MSRGGRERGGAEHTDRKLAACVFSAFVLSHYVQIMLFVWIQVCCCLNPGLLFDESRSVVWWIQVCCLMNLGLLFDESRSVVWWTQVCCLMNPGLLLDESRSVVCWLQVFLWFTLDLLVVALGHFFLSIPTVHVVVVYWFRVCCLMNPGLLSDWLQVFCW